MPVGVTPYRSKHELSDGGHCAVSSGQPASPVLDKPAAAFARAFYNALLDGKLLYVAANEARAATKALGDASWLSFKVYGHPRAKKGLSASAHET
jgi:hypothetical protein